jgi:protein-tyrosine phosphatase
MDKKLLFICTGNYYRSRFAEMFFNAQADQFDLSWTADSRGIETSAYNIGPIYPLVLIRLEMLGISIKTKVRMPIQLSKRDLEAADLVIALNQVEHMPLMKHRFANWVDKIVYWHIPDLNVMGSEEALSQIEKNVTALIKQLRDQAN